ncbi:MAG: type II secretion system F family protein [Methanobacteriota archaeon]
MADQRTIVEHETPRLQEGPLRAAEKEPPKVGRRTLWKVRPDRQARVRLAIIVTSGAIAGLFLIATGVLFFHGDTFGVGGGRWTDFLCAALLSGLAPWGVYQGRRARRMRGLEERFPDFLRDIAVNRKAGLTLPAAVTIASRGDYGELTPEIHKMADQLSWHVPYEEVLERFADRVDTPLVRRTVSLINEASRSGGSVSDVLMSAARYAREVKTLENERRSTMSMYTIIIYITFFVFLFVAAVLYGMFVPEILKAADAALAAGTSGFGGLSFGELTLEDYRVFYFTASMVQAVGNGIMAGIVETGRPVAGMRHSAIMVLITWIAFSVVL